jgi:hypothetical protein
LAGCWQAGFYKWAAPTVPEKQALRIERGLVPLMATSPFFNPVNPVNRVPVFFVSALFLSSFSVSALLNSLRYSSR